MATAHIVITLTPAQRVLIRQASGKNVTTLGIEPLETGAGCIQQRQTNSGC
jgi:hypothetical protein